MTSVLITGTSKGIGYDAALQSLPGPATMSLLRCVILMVRI